MSVIQVSVVSVHASGDDQLHKEQRQSIVVELDGIVGDRHRSHTRVAFAGDKQAEGTERRNERQWSAVSIEELQEISVSMDLTEPLSASEVGANLCLQGVPQLSRLPKGTILKFPSGAELIIAEYNPPCLDMGSKLASTKTTNSGKLLQNTAFSKAAKLSRGVVGVVDVAGIINTDDEVEVVIYEHPSWLSRLVV